MSRFHDDEAYDASDAGDVEMADVVRDDELLDQFSASFGDVAAAVSWNASATVDPAVHLLTALHADVSDLRDAPDFSHLVDGADSRTVALPVVDLAQRRRRVGRRSLVSGAVALAVLSASGVAAAGIVSDRGAPLYPIHQLLLGDEKTSSQKAADKVRKHLADAERGLDRSRLADASRALSEATTWLARVDAADRGALPTQLAALQSRYAAAVAAGGDPGNGNNGDNSGPGSGSSGHGSGTDDTSGAGSGSGSSGKGSGDDHGSGKGSGSGSGSGSSSDEHGSGSGSGSSGSGSSGSGHGSRNSSGNSSGRGGADTSDHVSTSPGNSSGHGPADDTAGVPDVTDEPAD